MRLADVIRCHFAGMFTMSIKAGVTLDAVPARHSLSTMSPAARVIRGLRFRSGEADESIEWVVARAASIEGRVGTHSATARTLKEPRPQRAASVAEIQAAMRAPDFAASEDEVLLVSAEDPQTLDRLQALLDLLEHRLGELADSEMLRLIDAVMPTLSDRPPPEVIDQARRNARARAQFLDEFPVLEASQVHALYGSRARNKSALAARWRAEGKVFAVDERGRLLYPAFQFDSQGRPRAVIAEVLTALGRHVGAWQVALWMTAPNGWLDGARPLDLLATAPERVVDAARDIADPTSH